MSFPNNAKVKAPDQKLEALTPYDPKYLPARVYLSANENPYPMPEVVRTAIQNAIADVSLNRYPDPLANDLREKIAEVYGLDRNQVLVGNGGDELLFNIALAWGGAGRSFLTTPPTFSVYETNALLTGTAVVQVPRLDDFSLDEAGVLDALKTRDIDFVIITNPNNPTGTTTSVEFLRTAANASDALFVVDEAYAEFSDSTMIPLLEELPNLLILRTFSKAYGLAGVRMGYVLGSSQVIRNLSKVRQPYSVDAVSQAIACATLDERTAFEPLIAEIKEQRAWVGDQLRSLEEIRVYPSDANYILFKVSQADQIWDELYEQGILIRNLSNTPGLKDCLRVTMGTPEENQQFMTALKEALRRTKA